MSRTLLLIGGRIQVNAAVVQFVMQASPNQPALRDTFMLSVGGKHHIASVQETLVRAGLTTPGEVGKPDLAHRVYAAVEEVFTLVSELPSPSA